VSAAARRTKRPSEFIGRAPLGYRNVRTVKTTYIELDKVASPFVREAFKLASRGISLTRVLAIITAKGLKTRTGRSLDPSALRKLLSNPVYSGVIRYGEALFPGTHPPLVSKDEFQRVQAWLGDQPPKAGNCGIQPSLNQEQNPG